MDHGRAVKVAVMALAAVIKVKRGMADYACHALCVGRIKLKPGKVTLKYPRQWISSRRCHMLLVRSYLTIELLIVKIFIH